MHVYKKVTVTSHYCRYIYISWCLHSNLQQTRVHHFVYKHACIHACIHTSMCTYVRTDICNANPESKSTIPSGFKFLGKKNVATGLNSAGDFNTLAFWHFPQLTEPTFHAMLVFRYMDSSLRINDLQILEDSGLFLRQEYRKNIVSRMFEIFV